MINPNATVGLSSSPGPEFRYVKATTAIDMIAQVERERLAIVAAFPTARMTSFDLMGAGAGAVYTTVIGFDAQGINAVLMPLVSDCSFSFVFAGEPAELLSETARVIAAAQLLNQELFGEASAGAGAGAYFMAGFLFASQGAVPSKIETVEYLPQPEFQRNGASSAFIAAATLAGSSFVLPRPVVFNRLIFEVTAFAAPATGVILIYQDPLGRMDNSFNLVATVPFAPAIAIFELSPIEGTVTLSDGIFYALWGQDSGAGSYSIRTYNGNSISLLTNGVIAGTHPVAATSALAAAAPPAILDPMVGGDLVEALALDVLPIIRLRNV